MRQGNDVGTEYRSGIYFANDAQKATAEMALEAYDEALRSAGHEPITTEVEPAGPFYYAEDYHQQYLHKVPTATAAWQAPASPAGFPPRPADAAEPARGAGSTSSIPRR